MRLGFVSRLFATCFVATSILACEATPPTDVVAATEASTTGSVIVPWRSVTWTGAWHFQTEYGNVTPLQIYQISAAQTGADGRVEIPLPFSCTDYPTTNVVAAPYAYAPFSLQYRADGYAVAPNRVALRVVNQSGVGVSGQFVSANVFCRGYGTPGTIAWYGNWHYGQDWGNFHPLELYHVTAAQTDATGKADVTMPFACYDAFTAVVHATPDSNAPLASNLRAVGYATSTNQIRLQVTDRFGAAVPGQRVSANVFCRGTGNPGGIHYRGTWHAGAHSNREPLHIRHLTAAFTNAQGRAEAPMPSDCLGTPYMNVQASVYSNAPFAPAYRAFGYAIDTSRIALHVVDSLGNGVPNQWVSADVFCRGNMLRPRAAAGDYDGDGITDPAVFRPSDATWYIRGSAPIPFGLSTDVPVPADYNGDGKTDVAVFRPSTGDWLIRNVGSVVLGSSGDIPVPADYDGDGAADAAVFRPSEGRWLFANKPPITFGEPGDVPAPADYDGDYTDEPAVLRRSTGTWYMYYGPSNITTRVFSWVTSDNDIPVSADYDGNKSIEHAVYRPASDTWWPSNMKYVYWGKRGDIVVQGDYDGDGRTQPAMFRPSEGKWYVHGVQQPIAWGQAGDIPVTNVRLTPLDANPPLPNVGSGFLAEYTTYDPTMMPAGYPLFPRSHLAKVERADATIDFDWQSGSPDPRISSDHFLARWTKSAGFLQGYYRFSVTADDGVRLYLDDRLLVDEWRDHGAPTTFHAERFVASGEHTLRVEYYERTGNARVQFSLASIPSLSTSYTGEYFANPNLSGSPALVREDPSLLFYWQNGSPATGLPADGFSARWTQDRDFAPGVYAFQLESDGGVRLWLDDELLVDDWSDHTLRTYQPVVNVSEGVHEIRVEYYDGSGPASVRLGVQPAQVPVLLVTHRDRPFSRYLAELLSSEGMNAFRAVDIYAVTPSLLASYDVVILGEMALTNAQATTFSTWVNEGGRLVAMRPDKKLSSLFGLTSTPSTLTNGYVQLSRTHPAASGIVGATMQIHGQADLYQLAGATSLATLFSTRDQATTSPATTTQNVGTNGGVAVAFTYDLAKSIVYTRQGNPDWSLQERDGSWPIRSNDLFHGASQVDPQPDWIDFERISIPQADEQQHFLANLVTTLTSDRRPVPRFWYFPKGKKAAVIMTGDDHATGGTSGRWQGHIAQSTSGCAVDDWDCIRATSYVYFWGPLANATTFSSQGFEIASHVNMFDTNCSASSIDSNYKYWLRWQSAYFPQVSRPRTIRTCGVFWCDYDSQPLVQLANGVRLDTNYYYWPAGWVGNRPGFFTGSGMPMRFATRKGELIDVYQAVTHMPDENLATYPFTINTYLDRALGAEGYYGAFTANMHTDAVASPQSDAIVASARARGVPVVSAAQMLTWLDARNGSSFSNIAWSGNTMGFTLSARRNARNIEAMLPLTTSRGQLTSLSRDGSPLTWRSETIKGIAYAVFAAGAGTYAATFTP